ncbi:unnamed protein product [Brassica oleracea var. botrytis]
MKTAEAPPPQHSGGPGGSSSTGHNSKNKGGGGCIERFPTPEVWVLTSDLCHQQASSNTWSGIAHHIDVISLLLDFDPRCGKLPSSTGNLISKGSDLLFVNKLVADDSQKKNRIQVSNIMKPLFFYVNLAKRYIQQYDDVELSVLGMGMHVLNLSLSYTFFCVFRL